MGLEVSTYIDGLVVTNPIGASDPKGQGDDHIRLLKATIKNTFPNLTGAMTLTQAQINALNTKAGLEAILLAATAFGGLPPQLNTPSAATDWNTLVAPGWFPTVESAGAANAPEAGSTWLGMNILAKDANNLVQIAIPDVPTTAQAKGIYIRSRVAGVWSAWRHIIWETDITALFTARNTAALTYTNKSLVDASTWIVDDVDATKKLQFQLAGFTTGTTRVLTPPNYNGTIATLDGVETLTNKTVKATTLAANGAVGGTAMTFNWSGQGGQPSWLWGSNDGASHQVYNPSNFAVASAVTATTASFSQTGGAPDAVLEDQKAQNVDGGSFVSGAWRTRDLNTETRDPNGYIALAANQFVPAVNGWVEWSAPSSQTEQHQTRLFNVTDGVAVAYGVPGSTRGDSPMNTPSYGGGPVTAGKTYRIEHRCMTTSNTDGLGLASNFGTEVYTRVQFWRTS